MNAREYRDTWLFKVLIVSDGWVLGPKYNINITPSRLSENFRGVGKKESWHQEMGCETLSCAHDTISAIIISQQLQQPAMGLNKTGPVTSQSWTGEGLIRPYLSLFKYCLLMEPKRDAAIIFSREPLMNPTSSTGQLQTHGHTDDSSQTWWFKKQNRKTWMLGKHL